MISRAGNRRSTHNRRLKLGAAAALLLLTTQACSREDAGPAADAPIRIGVPSIPPAIGNPYQGITIPGTLALQAIFDTMTQLDEKGEIQPGLALSWQAEDERTWVLKLRPDVKFSNGEPFTAEAVIESVRHMTSDLGRTETIGSALQQIRSAEAVDPLTVRLKLDAPDPLLPLHITSWRIPAPAHWRTLKLPADAKDAIGSGPFQLEARQEGQLVLKPNPGSWRKPQSNGVVLVLIPDTTARLQAFASGAVDIAMVLSVDAADQIGSTGGKVVTRKTPQVDFIGFNTVNKPDSPLRDPRVRLALNLATNRDALAKTILKDATAPASQLSVPGAFGYAGGLTALPYDPERAKRLLAEAGYPNGLNLTMTTTAGEVAGDDVVYPQIAQDLARVGVKVEVRGRPATRQMQELFSGKIAADMFSWSTRGFDPLTDYRHRSCADSASTRFPYHCDRALTKMVVAASAEPDVERRRKLYADVASYELSNPPGIILWQRPDFDAVAQGIDGYAPVQDDIGLERLRRTQP